ncbi:MAG: OmpA family protein [Sedimentisphaerales bacterium]|nr:OmpA family protein [Sedimentisphaerales bacterium]
MAKKQKKAPEGAPDWMVTYGDMMTLLLCFFVILVSLSEIKQDERFQEAMESIKRAFGYMGGAGAVPSQDMPTNSMVSSLEEIVSRRFQLQEGQSSDEGIEGESSSVVNIRQGPDFVIGGRIAFEMGRARLLEGAQEELRSFAARVIGMNTKIRVRGHAMMKPEELYAPYASLDDLSYARAVAVKAFLVSLGIREERITLEACGAGELLRTQAYDEESRAMNRRVEIIVTENLIEDYQGGPPENSTGTISVH